MEQATLRLIQSLKSQLQLIEASSSTAVAFFESSVQQIFLQK